MASHGRADHPYTASAVSTLCHVIVLLLLALIVGDDKLVEKLTLVATSDSDPEEPDHEIEIPKEDEVPVEETEPVAEVNVPAEAVIEVADIPRDTGSPDGPLGEIGFDIDLTSPENTAALAKTLIPGVGGPGGFDGRRHAYQIALRDGGDGTVGPVDRALTWLAAHQLPDGGWSFDLEACPSCAGKCSHSGTTKKDDRAGATVLVLLPFLGRGYTHRDGPYKRQVEGGIAFLVQRAMKHDGKVYDKSGSLYSQGLAGIALSECHAMSQDQRLAAPTQAVLNFIMQAQDPQGGGWRYSPRQPGDTSAVGWQIMALKSGNMAYLDVNPLTVKKAVEFLDSVKGDEYGATYGYTGPGNKPGTSAVGLLCRMYLGWRKDNPGLLEGAAKLAKLGPSQDLYYDYYATQIMHHMQGDMWQNWNATMKKLLIDAQATKDHEAGSWFAGVEGGHGVHAAGRVYCTALATMILEVYYRHLPIYRDESVEDEFRE